MVWVVQLHKADNNEYDYVSVNPSRFLKTNEPFILVDQASQVFYANDNSNKGWHVVRTLPNLCSNIFLSFLPTTSLIYSGENLNGYIQSQTTRKLNDDDLESPSDAVDDLESPTQKKRKRTDEVRFIMKTENEYQSTIKSTMRYTFCAPGAIEKGRGRGLRSLITKGKTLSKSSLSSIGKGPKEGVTNSTMCSSQIMEMTIHKRYGSTGKEQGKGITSSTMLSGHVMGTTMYKNSVVRENEYMQVDTPFSSSTNQVKQRTKEAEAIAIGKGPDGEDIRMGTIRKNSLVLEKMYKQVDTTFSPSTNQVKQRTKEAEIRVFKNSVGSNQGMRSMGNNPLILGKENMQTNISLPPSPDKVMKPSQTVEIGSSNPKKVKRIRGSNKCKEVASLEIGQKLKVTFYNNRTVGKNSNLFSRNLKKIIHDTIEDKFESDDMNDHRDHIFEWMNELWNKWRGHLHIFRNKRNTTNRANLTVLHHIGSKSIREIMYQQGGKDENPPDLGTIFYETRKKDNKLVEPEAIEKHVRLIEEIVKAEPSLPTIEIVEKCWGPQNRSHVVFFGGRVKAKDMKGGTSLKTELLSALHSTREDNKSLIEENKSVNDRLSTLEDEMEKIRKMQEFFAAQQSHIPHTTPPVSTE
ncbi:hypothetical protein P3L10_004963 [Capsicum annuum]